ncbi:RAI1-domain-containing protein [Dichomitus squalens LYAD-421 SS1]|uniref:RAI1-domain-containing protein n=1 Tax=Dichomitus squalens (strain LYAD-421) TaxID=732165 RepID=UPI0004412871|nr:RAI1-domain-containing protein [Dichomitus squalens LYAD-421 SS1]EJF63130.1 RAI1-domain-containing protein [Dichomitus squalens LYAD-421 SS1]
MEFGDSALRYYIDPPPGADLRYGYERWVKRPEERARLDTLLKAIERVLQNSDTNMGPGSGKKWLRDIALVTWRGVMTKILTAPYEERDSCVLNAMLVDGTLYLEEHLTDARLAEKEDLPTRQRQQTYYGYAFESWCTSSRPGVPERIHGHPTGWGGDVDTNVQWCSVVKTKLGDSRLVIGGEVDCVREHFNGQPDNFVELKTSMSIRNAQDEARFEKKLLKFYVQSFLLGVPEIVVGFRTPAGRITTTQSFKTIQMPRLVRGKPHAWDPQICLRWGQEFLASLKARLSEQASSAQTGPSPTYSSRVWRVTLTPGLGVSVYPLDEEGVKEVQGGEDRVGFLPSWYFEQVAEPAEDRSVPGQGTSGSCDGTTDPT